MEPGHRLPGQHLAGSGLVTGRMCRMELCCCKLGTPYT